MRILLTTILIFISVSMFGEGLRYHSNWIYGYHCSTSWDENNNLTMETNPVINTAEGVSTWSDPVTGELILFTDGMTAWNKNNQIISNNALGGHNSASQSGVIIPVPETTNSYYIIANYYNVGHPLKYTKFNMDLNNGAGAQVGVTQTIGNSTGNEVVGAITHANGKDFWVLTADSHNIFVSLVSSTGISSATTYTFTEDINAGLGQIVFNSDGTKFALSGSGDRNHIFNFDKATGVVNNIVELPNITVSDGNYTSPDTPANWNGTTTTYGIAFSPDDTKLYIQVYRPGPTIFQYDLNNNNSVTELGNATGRNLCNGRESLL